MKNEIENIYKEYNHLLLLLFISRRVPNRFIAEDILQDVFIKVLNNYNQLKDHKKN